MRILICPLLCVLALLFAGTGTALAQAPVSGYEVIRTYPHDTSAFTEGLIRVDGKLYESTGRYGASSLREVDLTTGAVLRRIDLDPQYFGEGMTLFQGKIFLLTWREHTGFIYDPATFSTLGQFFYPGEGWGLTHDNQHLIMSDGTNEIQFLDPSTLQPVRSIFVFDQGVPLTNLNELEYVNGEIYANVWLTDLIVRIDPASGAILGWIDMTGLLPAGTPGDWLNGIAYDDATHQLFVAGKLWPSLYEIRLVGGRVPAAQDQSLSTSEDTSRAITLTATDADGDPLTFSIVSNPLNGTLSGAPPLVSYVPAANYHGTDSFTFRANDGTFDSNVATVSLSVAPVNDAPVAVSESYTTSANTPLALAAPGVLGNDSDIDGDPLTAIRVSGPSHGTLTLNANGGFTYTPSPNYSGADVFTYTARDAVATSNVASVSFTITPPAAAPIVALSPASLKFGNQSVGSASAAQAITVSNTGTGQLLVSAITITGANASEFTQTNSCGGSIAGGASCAISVTFTPATTGARKAAVSVIDNASGSPRTIPLTGTGKKSGR